MSLIHIAGKTLSRLARYIGKSKFALLGIVLLTVVIAFADLVGPKLQQLAIDTITVTDGVVKVDFQAMLTYIAIMSGFFVFSALLTLCLLYTSYKYGFIQRYPQSKSSVTKSSHYADHYRYVGYPHALAMMRKDVYKRQGIITSPKYSEDQANYISPITCGASALCVPANLSLIHI